MSLSNKVAITDVDLKDKRVLIRVRFPLERIPKDGSMLTMDARSTSMSPSTPTKRSPTTSVSSVPSPPSSTPSRMAPRLSSSCPISAVLTARSTPSTV